MGPFEYVLDQLYGVLQTPAHQGLIVALAYRIICVVVAAAGAVYYLLSKPTSSTIVSSNGLVD
jgi:hypothetical protein